MNPLIKKELKKLNVPFVMIDETRCLVDDIPEDTTEIIIQKKTAPLRTAVKENTLYHFVLDKKLVKCTDLTFHNKWNKGVPVPLTFMYGTIVEELDSMYYVKLYGSDWKSVSCHHCLRFIEKDTLCDSCKKSLGIIVESDIQNIRWEGWIPKDGIKEIVAV